ncbi:1,2-phenylacetyl-CoA epoxidase subunit PaaC [Prauserella endophytica]|uniref:Phenylacetate-CoA oxygenase subunit PaaC n=1 Tax=Prauserella endophytica TaxID=1592324 RepID=A0ABY2S4G8_9PSEU|nr:1,2-phenylacetyl-CoA epoxidase subunit PaaC [Prauserella endophytica]PXY33186.1 phenylacetate-CoA oxygenase subunit PaaI [Prauserella coralliicola]TKG70763.1 phenylacetate-CoA oxygenase subunit PaaC [Prauserella endophytica]
MSFDNAYEAITEENDSRWAFGTGFEDPLSGVDATVPSGVDGADLAAYCLMLGDDALIFSHRLQEWCTNAPELEDEVAIANIGLDLLGQARLLLARAGKAEGGDRGEDHYAFFRAENEFRNVRLAELPRGDFGELIARLLVFSTWRLALLQRLVESRDPVLAAIAAKGVKEVTYHRDYAAQWAVRLGDGTEYSRERMTAGLASVWPYADELFTPHPVELRLAGAGVAVDPSATRAEFDDVLGQVLRAATLEVPEAAAIPGVAGKAGRHGVHTEAMGYLLAELQSVARAHPEATW